MSEAITTAAELADHFKSLGMVAELRETLGMGYYFMHTRTKVYAWSDRSLSGGDCYEPWAEALVVCPSDKFNNWVQGTYEKFEFPIYTWELT